MGIYRQYENGWSYRQFNQFAKELLRVTNNDPVILEFVNANDEIPADQCQAISEYLVSAAFLPEMAEHAPAMEAIAEELQKCAANNSSFIVE